MAKRGLGRGLDALLYENETERSESGSGVRMLRLSDIEPNPGQARKNFDPEALQELCDSIKLHGLLQPIAVREKSGGFYEIIAGERRWRACRMAGLAEIPCVIRDAGDDVAAFLSLVENLQREGLNPIEEAEGYRSLMESFGLTQEEAAEKVGKSRSSVANLLRILRLPEAVRALVAEQKLSYGHARSLLPLCGVFPEDAILKTAQNIIENSLSVRQTEQLVKRMSECREVPTELPVRTAYYRRLENRASAAMGRRVTIRRRPDGTGSLALAYGGTDDLEELMKALCGAGFFETED